MRVRRRSRSVPRARAYWLTVPALALGSAGFLAGHAARAGVTGDTTFGDVDYYLQPGYDLRRQRA